MRFDISKIDLKLLLRALIFNSEPKGIGEVEYVVRKNHNEIVDSITDDEFDELMSKFVELEEGALRIVDYYKGKPIKFDLRKKINGQIIADSSAFDSRIGKYKFLEILLDYFDEKDFKIVKKNYSSNNFPESDLDRKLKIKFLQQLTKNTIEKRDKFGRFWILDSEKIIFQSDYDKLLN